MKAVIFDMDGVIVDSEPLWKRAEKEIFSSLGVMLDEDSCHITKHMTTTEVTKFWYDRNPWKNKSLSEVELLVIDRVIALIERNECIIPDVAKVAKSLKRAGFKLGLATNSPFKIIPKVLEQANLLNTFDAISSSEFEKHGKPQPDVYLSTMKKLDIKASNCIAIEDSNSGIIAAKKAGIKVMAFRDNHKNKLKETVFAEIQAFKAIDFSIFK